MAGKNWHERRRDKRRFWQAHIRAWEKSGLSQNEYCHRNKLKSSQLCYWKKKVKGETSIAVKFMPVPVANLKAEKDSCSTDSGLTIIIDDIKIKLRRDFSSTALTKAVTALGGRL